MRLNHLVVQTFAAPATPSLAFPQLNVGFRNLRLSRRGDIDTESRKWQKNCQNGNLGELEQEDWDSMKDLAVFAQKWTPYGAYQSTANLYFGIGSADHHERIINYYKNVASFHDSPSFWWGPNNGREGALYEVWCAEDGADGKVPRPDEWSEDKDWNADVCAGNETWAYSFRRHRWWWIHNDVYYTVFCEKSWRLKENMTRMNDLIAERGKNNLDMDFLFKLRASTYLHEILHHKIVSEPRIRDVMIRWQWGKGAYVYSPSFAAYFAKWIGPLKKVPDEKGGYGGEFGTVLNAENYVAFALSVYFQEKLSHAQEYEPKNPAWKDWDQEEADPYPGHPLFASGIHINSGTFEGLEDIDDERPLAPSIVNKPLCVDGYRPDPDQQSFSQSDGIGVIQKFCSKHAGRDLMLTPLISIGNGQTINDQDKIPRYDNAPSRHKAPEKGIWLFLRFADDGSIGSFMIGQGKTTEEKVQHCIDRFSLIMNNCQTNTITEKYGGALQVGSAYYQMAGRYENMTDIFRFGPVGALSCRPTDAKIIPSLAKSGTCKYANYKATDVFKLPASGSCNDVDPTHDMCDDQPRFACSLGIPEQ